MAALLLVLMGRLWWLQLTHWSQYTTRALKNRTIVVEKPAPRGLIYDRRGDHILAENREVWSVHVIPADLPLDEVELEREVQFLASTLSSEDAPVSTADVREAMNQTRGAKAAEPIPLGDLGQDLTFDQVAAIEEKMIELPGIVAITSTRRHYPYGRLASQAIGYARRISKEQLERFKGYEYPADPRDPTEAELGEAGEDAIFRPDAIIGAEGAEALCEMELGGDSPCPILPGRRGRTIYEVDATGLPQRLIAKREPTIGARVYLTLDADIQYVAERALRQAMEDHPERMGAAVVIDTRNGDLIALASEPSLDPNDWVSGLVGEQWREALDAPGLPLYNKALSGTYPPGSVFKVISVCAAMETTKVTRHTSATCTGLITVGRRHDAFKCWIADRGGHGQVDLTEAIAQSCNVWFYKTVLDFKLDATDISKYAHRFGLGELTGLGLKGESAGEVPDPKYGEKPWRTGNSLNYVIGQDRLTVTPLQMCRAVAAIANGGKLLRPNLVRRVRWPSYLNRKDTMSRSGSATRINVKKETLQMVREGMRRAVTGEHGTARSLADLPVKLAGKTGTAQHRLQEENHSWFVGFGPYDAAAGDPQYAVCVFVARGGTGSTTSVPIGKEVFKALFKLYGPDEPGFKLYEPLDPAAVAAKRKARVAAAKARAEDEEPAKDKADENKPAEKPE